MHENIERIVRARRRHVYAKFRLPDEQQGIKGECWIKHACGLYFASYVWVDSLTFHVTEMFMITQGRVLASRTIKQLCAELKRKGIDLEQATSVHHGS